MIDLRELDQVRYRFTELGQTLHQISEQNTDLINQTVGDLREGFEQFIEEIFKNPALQQIRNQVEGASRAVDQTVGAVSQISNVSDQKLQQFNGTINQASAGIKDFSEKFKRGTSTYITERDRQINVAAVKVDIQQVGPQKPPPTLMQREIGAVKSKARSFWSGTLKMPSVGQVLGGSIMMMSYGFMYQDRIRAEAGEVRDILVSAFEDGVKGSVRKATQYVSSLQETLQKYFGIARAEVQNTLSVLVEGGLKTDEWRKVVDEKLGLVGSSTLSLTLGLDKLINVAGGTSAKQMVTYMGDYGKSVDEARESVYKMVMLGRQSGIGTEQFMKNIETASDSLKTLGYDIDDVIDTAVVLQDKFENMGVPRQFAGRQAAMGLSQAAQGISNMKDEWKVFLGEKMGYGKGLEAKQGMMDAFDRVLRGDQRDELTSLLSNMVEAAQKLSGGDAVMTREILQSEKGMGLGVEGSRAALMIKEAIDKGDLARAAQIAGDNYNQLKDAYQTEAQKMSRWQREKNRWLESLAKVGQGMLGVVTAAMATFVASIQALPAMLVNVLTLNSEKNDKILQDLEKFSAKIGPSFEKMADGFIGLGKAMGGMAETTFGEAGQTMKDAFAFAPWSTDSKGTSTPLRKTQQAPAVVRVMIPVDMKGSYEVSAPEVAGDEIEGEYSEWVGSGLSIISHGADEMGNIEVGIVGSCPRCGLEYGDAADFSPSVDVGIAGLKSRTATEQDVETLARMMASEAREGAGSKEMQGIGWTAINRWKSWKDFKKGSLHDVITGGKGYGRQGSDRAFSTARPATKASRKLAREMLAGNVDDPTGGASYFYHDTGGAGYGHRTDRSKRTALPGFATQKDFVPSATHGSAVFGHRGGGPKDQAAVTKQREIGKKFAPKQKALNREYERQAVEDVSSEDKMDFESGQSVMEEEF